MTDGQPLSDAALRHIEELRDNDALAPFITYLEEHGSILNHEEAIVSAIWFVTGLATALNHPEWARAIVEIDAGLSGYDSWDDPHYRSDCDEIVSLVPVEAYDA
jgi:hypothetical protein